MSLTGTFNPDNLIGGDKKVVTEEVLVPSGNNLTRGTVLGRVKTSTPTTGTIAGTGNGTCTAVTGGPKTIPGDYVATCVVAITNGGTFEVRNPNGDLIGQVVITAGAGGTGVFASEEINFTLTDGTTDFALTDTATITVTDGVPNSAACVGTGNGTLTLVEGRSSLMVGAYVIECTAAVTHGGVFKITNPDGNVVQSDITIPPGAGNYIDFVNDELVGRITDGSTDFVAGDTFTITVTISPRQVLACDKTATDGSSAPYAVLLQDLDATSAAKTGIGALEGQFNERRLVFASGTDVEDLRDQMRDLGMIVVPSEPAGAA